MIEFNQNLLKAGDLVEAELLNDLFWNGVTAFASAVLRSLGMASAGSLVARRGSARLR